MTEVTEKRIPSLLFICTQPRAELLPCVPNHGEWFRNGFGLPDGSYSMRVVYAADEALPREVNEDAVVIGGSMYSVRADLPWVRSLSEFVRGLWELQVPTLGVCFGHQLIAEALGGIVIKGEAGPEVGVARVQITETGRTDPLFHGITDDELHVAMYHEDVVVTPPRQATKELARNGRYRYQALAYGDTMRSVQFHPEMTPELIGAMMHAHKDQLRVDGVCEGPENIAGVAGFMKRKKVPQLGTRILQNFFHHFVV